MTYVCFELMMKYFCQILEHLRLEIIQDIWPAKFSPQYVIETLSNVCHNVALPSDLLVPPRAD